MTAGQRKIPIALIGAGAVTEFGHLPAARKEPLCEVVALVDPDLNRAKLIAKQFGISKVTQDLESVVESIEGAIVATPHHLHADLTCRLLERGVHVLVEKPMALTVRDCERMIDAARTANRILAVGMLRRFLPGHLTIRKMIETNWLGRIEEVDIREGNVFRWPVRSRFQFSREFGGGVLFDTGAHTLDLLLWWFGDLADIDYLDNASGGVESDAELHFQTATGVKGVVELSRTRDLRNTARIRGEQGTLEVGIANNQLTLQLHGVDAGLVGSGWFEDPETARSYDYRSLYAPQLNRWLESIQTGGEPAATGHDGLRAVTLIDRCLKSRKLLGVPHDAP